MNAVAPIMKNEYDVWYTMERMLLEAGAKPEYAAPFRNVVLSLHKPDGTPYAPRQDQIEALRKQVTYKRFGLFSEARTGKSISFTVGCIYFAHWKVKSIILMPPVLFLQYKELWKEIENNPASLHIFNQGPKTREAALQGWMRDPASAPDVLVMTSVLFKKHLHDLIGAGYRNLVFDECHLGGLLDEKSLSYKAVREFVSASQGHRATLSTGTPLPNELVQAYPMISLINPGAYHNRDAFNRRHVEWVPVQIGYRRPKIVHKIGGYKNVPLLHQNLYAYAHRVTKAEVLQLHMPNIQIIPVQLSAAHYSLYERLMTARVLEHQGDIISAATAQALRQMALKLITTPEDFGDVGGNAIVELVQEILGEVGASYKEKVVVFANYNRSVETLHDALKDYNPAIIYGPSSHNARDAERFKKDPECRVLVANPIAGGVGLTLGGVSSTAIFAEPVSTPGAFDQACSRVMLAGQTEPVSVYLFKVLGTISPRAIKLMMRKAGEVREANRDKKTLLDELLGGADD